MSARQPGPPPLNSSEPVLPSRSALSAHDRLGVSRQTVNAIETERFDPSLPLAFKIARIFDQSIEAIFHPELDA